MGKRKQFVVGRVLNGIHLANAQLVQVGCLFPFFVKAEKVITKEFQGFLGFGTI